MCHFTGIDENVRIINNHFSGFREDVQGGHFISTEKTDSPRQFRITIVGNMLIGNGKSVTDNVHVDSVVDVHFLVAKKLSEDPDLVGGQAYFVSDDEPTNPVVWYRPIVEGLGYSWPKLHIPFPAAYTIAYAGELAHYLGGPFPMLTRRGVLSVCRDASFRVDKARAQLGYEPRTSAAEGIPDLMHEFRATHDRLKAAQ